MFFVERDEEILMRSRAEGWDAQTEVSMGVLALVRVLGRLMMW